MAKAIDCNQKVIEVSSGNSSLNMSRIRTSFAGKDRRVDALDIISQYNPSDSEMSEKSV